MTTSIYSLSLHDALPIYELLRLIEGASLQILVAHVLNGLEHRPLSRKLFDPVLVRVQIEIGTDLIVLLRDRKSTRLNSSHPSISYAVFCLKKKKQKL